MQMEIEKTQQLLNYDGSLKQEGWARHQLWRYDRRLVAKPQLLLKEWNRYLVMDAKNRWLILSTASQIGGKAIYSITYADLGNRILLSLRERVKATDETRLPLSSDEDDEINFSCNEIRTAFIRRGNIRNVMVSAAGFDIPEYGIGMDARFKLSHRPDAESFTSAVSFNKSRKSFLLNEIETCIPVSGLIRRGNDMTEISWQDGVVAISDWGRGRFSTKPMSKVVFCGKAGETAIGFCLTGNNDCALSVDGKLHILEGITLENKPNGFIINSKTSGVELMMDGALTNEESGLEQLFGQIEGSLSLDDGRKLKLEGLPGMVWRSSEK